MLIVVAPARRATASMRPSTWAGTPATMSRGAAPSRSIGQCLRTSAWSPPMPPEAISTAPARTSKSPTSARLELAPRGTVDGSSTSPATPVTRPLVRTMRETRWRNRKTMRPASACACVRRSNGASTPGPVPQVTWKRGTELPWPSALPPPRSAQPTTGNQRMPMPWSHARISPAAKSMKASAVRLGQPSSGRSNCAEPSQSWSARAGLSRMRMRRCSGLSTRKSPPSDQNAWPPRALAPSCSTTITRLPRAASSSAATSPASPAPTTTASASMRLSLSPGLPAALATAGKPVSARSADRSRTPGGGWAPRPPRFRRSVRSCRRRCCR